MDRLEGALNMREAIDLLETAARHEDAGATVVSPRLNTNFVGGWMRILFAVDKASGYFATKAYHLIQGSGVRYVVSLYALKDGALIAMIDGRAITDTGTVTARVVVRATEGYTPQLSGLRRRVVPRQWEGGREPRRGRGARRVPPSGRPPHTARPLDQRARERHLRAGVRLVEDRLDRVHRVPGLLLDRVRMDVLVILMRMIVVER